ncbi:hypothetical protein [Paucisalibacillus globulus]|uniref:hypothetical protein n=1 Tax=Paucisalibacillus globulus TaxID=351095 RepID=UPI000BB945D1|nr:hypothetical protein [Paucisalibacillus globulus]
MKLKNRVALGFYIFGLFLYLVSFLGSFSIGLYILLPAIFVLMIGMAVNLGLYKKQNYYVIPILTSIVIAAVTYPLWNLLVYHVDDYYIFYPFTFFFS